jgi:hypothetical protein
MEGSARTTLHSFVIPLPPEGCSEIRSSVRNAILINSELLRGRNKLRALEVRLVRGVQVPNLKSLVAQFNELRYQEFVSRLRARKNLSFHRRVHEGKPKARGVVGRNNTEIRRTALADTAFNSVVVQGTRW